MANILDCLTKEDRVDVTFTVFYKLVRESAKAEFIENAARADVPNAYILKMLNGAPTMERMSDDEQGGSD